MPAVSSTPYYCRCEDEKLGRVGFWDPMGPYSADQSVGAANSGSLGLQRVKFGLHPACDAALRAAGKTPIFANISRSGTDLTHWLTGQYGQTFFAQTVAEILVNGVTSTDWHIVFLQGENDCRQGGTYVTNRQANVTAFAAFARTLLPGARFYMVKMNSALSGAINLASFQAAEAAFVVADGNAETLNCDTFSYDGLHYTGAGYNSIGALLAGRILANLPVIPTPVSGGPPPRSFVGTVSASRGLG